MLIILSHYLESRFLKLATEVVRVDKADPSAGDAAFGVVMV